MIPREQIERALRVVGRERVELGARVFAERPDNGHVMDYPYRPDAQISDCFVGWMDPDKPGAPLTFSKQMKAAADRGEEEEFSHLSTAYEYSATRPLLQECVAAYLKEEA